MDYLILINTKYPFKAGEAFIESEIKEIYKAFDKIFIFPIDVIITDKQTRKIDTENVEYYVFEKGNPNIRKAKSAVKSIITMWGFKGNIKHNFFDAVFQNTAKAQARKILSILKHKDFKKTDTITIYSYWFYVAARIGMEVETYFKSMGIGCRLISRAHRFDIYESNNERRYLPQRELLLANVEAVYACSENGANYLRQKYPKYSDKVRVSFLGTYDHGLGMLKINCIFSIVSCSRVTHIKRVGLIIESLKVLEESGYKVKWTHIGDGPLLNDIKKKAKVLQKTEVSFLGGIPNSEVYEYYRQNTAHIFINVSSSEGLPVSIMEAISFGIPVIATNTGGTNEIVVDGITGTLIPIDFSPSELSKKIEAYINLKEEEYCSLRKRAREFWQNHFDAKHNYRNFASSIKQVEISR